MSLPFLFAKTILILRHLWQFIGDSGLIIGKIDNFSAVGSAGSAAIEVENDCRQDCYKAVTRYKFQEASSVRVIDGMR